MAVQPIDTGDLGRAPFWQVTAVYGDDEGPGFAYTTGLHAHGLPELHIWAQPDRGDDPGADWAFSSRDQGHLLNRLARQLVDGTLRTGQQFTECYDDGQVTVRFRIGEPGDRMVLEAYGTDPDATVWPVNWSLHRPVAAPPTPLAPDALAAARAEAEALRQRLAGTVGGAPSAVPEPWRPESRPRFDPDQVFGPRTPLVRLRAAQLLAATPETLGELLVSVARVDYYDSLTTPTSVGTAVARRAGRTAAVANVCRQVDGLVEGFLDRAVRDGSWAAALEAGFGPQLESSASVAEAIDHVARTRLMLVAQACLTIEAVADVVDPAWVCHVRGPWLTALSCEPGELPGPGWCASSDVLASITRLLTPLSGADLMQIARDHTIAAWGAEPDFGYQELVMRLHTWSLLGGADCPWSPTLDELPGWADVLRPLGLIGPDGSPRSGVSLGRLPELHDWARALAAALSHRARLSAEDVATLLRPVAGLLPGLEVALNGGC